VGPSEEDEAAPVAEAGNDVETRKVETAEESEETNDKASGVASAEQVAVFELPADTPASGDAGAFAAADSAPDSHAPLAPSPQASPAPAPSSEKACSWDDFDD
jgi:hypothetical protein